MRIIFSRQVEKFLAKLQRYDSRGARLLTAEIQKLADNAEPPGSKQMKEFPHGCRRVSGGDYRAIYSQLEDGTIEIEFAEHRKIIYEKYKRRAK